MLPGESVHRWTRPGGPSCLEPSALDDTSAMSHPKQERAVEQTQRPGGGGRNPRGDALPGCCTCFANLLAQRLGLQRDGGGASLCCLPSALADLFAQLNPSRALSGYPGENPIYCPVAALASLRLLLQDLALFLQPPSPRSLPCSL